MMKTINQYLQDKGCDSLIRVLAVQIAGELFNHPDKMAKSCYLFSQIFKGKNLSTFEILKEQLNFHSASRVLEENKYINFDRGCYRLTKKGCDSFSQ